nr:hypothetical protein TorRG33x02_249850 [Ipomoea trifida]
MTENAVFFNYTSHSGSMIWYGWIIKMVASAAANGGEAFDDKVGADFEFEVNEDKEVKGDSPKEDGSDLNFWKKRPIHYVHFISDSPKNLEYGFTVEIKGANSAEGGRQESSKRKRVVLTEGLEGILLFLKLEAEIGFGLAHLFHLVPCHLALVGRFRPRHTPPWLPSPSSLSSPPAASPSWPWGPDGFRFKLKPVKLKDPIPFFDVL